MQHDKDKSGKGAGVCILNFRNSINQKIRIDLVSDNLEAVSWEIYKTDSRNFTVSSTYCSPGSSPEILLALKK